MGETGQGAGERPTGVTARRQNTKPPVSARRPRAKTARIQLHLGETTVKRLAVHAALEGRNQSREADRILAQYLRKHGKGREMFPDDGDSSDQGEPDGPTE